MIITDEELEKAEFIIANRVEYTCGLPNCNACSTTELPPIEDLIKDLIEARKQIKVLEGGQCIC